MRRRPLALATSAVAFVMGGIACVDLFHSTDFETLCSTRPSDARCVSDGASGPDVVSEGGNGPRPPHPNYCAWSSERARSEAMRACVWLGACDGPFEQSAFGPCVVRAQLAFDCQANPDLRPAGATDDFWSCLATVRSCGDVDRCVFPSGAVEKCVEISSGTFNACGNGNTSAHVNCAAPGLGRPVGVEPCAMRGKTCSRIDIHSASCTGTRDENDSGVNCTTSKCKGTSAIACRSGPDALDDGFDCASQGGTCIIVAGAPACTSPKGAACAVASPPTCDADKKKVTACVGGHEVSVDCSLLYAHTAADGFGCDVSKLAGADVYDLTAACVASASTCTDEETCTGTSITSCGRGVAQTFDCGSAGLGACRKNSATGKVACSPP